MGKVAFVFPGQGSQTVGMGMELCGQYKSAAGIYEMAGDAVKHMCFEGPQSSLDLTVNAQPCLFITDLAYAYALVEIGVHADGATGFSLGEIPALAFSGLLNAEQAFKFVNFRAKAMHERALNNPGGMAAVMGLDPEDVIRVCDETEGAYPANFNSGKQTVAAFSEGTFEALKNKVSAMGGKVIRLATSGAFHSPFMDGAAADIGEYLKSVDFGEMKIPLYANATARIYDNPAELLTRQVNSPVLWRLTVENMIQDGYDTFIEAGPGKTLTGLIKKINKDVTAYSASEKLNLSGNYKKV